RLAGRIWDDTTAILGSAMANILDVFNPRLIVLGGRVTRAGDHLLRPVREAGLRQAMGPAARTGDIVLAELAGHRGVTRAAVDAQHLAAELIGRYLRERRPLPAIALSVDPSVVTCIANDYAFDAVFARQVEALAGPGDVVVAFTTSGRSQNVVDGLAMARRRGATTVLFGGGDGGPASEHADFALIVPGTITARIQEMHLLMLHLLSDAVDRWAAGDG